MVKFLGILLGLSVLSLNFVQGSYAVSRHDCPDAARHDCPDDEQSERHPCPDDDKRHPCPDDDDDK